jgi:TPR repeat protein
MTPNYLTELRLNAEQGDAAAQFNLGTAYSQGASGQPNIKEAAKWYLKAAEQGHAYSQHQIGLFYFHGWGVPEDYAEAEKWYRKAEEQGLNEAKRARENLQYTIKAAEEEKCRRTDQESARLFERYEQGARIFGSITAIVVFLCSWIYFIATYGYLFGFGLGWLPSGILAVISGFIAGWLWPLIFLGIIILMSIYM